MKDDKLERFVDSLRDVSNAFTLFLWEWYRQTGADCAVNLESAYGSTPSRTDQS